MNAVGANGYFFFFGRGTTFLLQFYVEAASFDFYECTRTPTTLPVDASINTMHEMYLGPVVNHLRDRAHLRIRVQPNMEMIGDPRYQNRKLLLMSVANAGRRPITITSVGAHRLYPHNPFVIADTRPACPCELTEGKEMNVIVNQKDLDLSVIESWEA